ncbi:hypothetical protein RhiLY_08608 [Ceratobasidium sp. AG-Ba]|nr:hypothetical protein RhiLY_08608 [Ceratobasidium sp. AG-Ba]
MSPQQLTDVDSVILIAKDRIPMVDGVTLRYFMLQSHRHTLDSDLHIPPVQVRDEHGDNMLVHPHKVPNARFLEADGHMEVKICFPRLERAAGSSMIVTSEEHEMLYDEAMLPAGQEKLAAEVSGTWPPTYRSEIYRGEDIRNQREAGEGASGGRGRRVQQSEWNLDSEDLNQWVARIRELVNRKAELAWARSFFFVVQLRGLKGEARSVHFPPIEPPVLPGPDGDLDHDSPRVISVENRLHAFATSEFEVGACFVDLGMNIRLRTHDGDYACPLPAADAHASILAHVLGLPLQLCEKWVSSKGGNYQRDELAGLKTVAGFRFRVPKEHSGNITYIQLYFCDKILTYNLGLPQHTKLITCKQVMEDFDKWRSHHFQPLLEAFKKASSSYVMHMRLEVRVEYHAYPCVQLQIPDVLMRSWMYMVEPETFWGWKYFRLTSIYSVLRAWMNNRAVVRSKQLSKYCSLFVALIWMANALVHRPDDGGTWDEVRDASSVHAVGEDGELVPVWPLRAHFLHSLKFAPGRPPRMSGDRLISLQTILFAFYQTTERQLHTLITQQHSSGLQARQNIIRSEELQRELLRYPQATANRRREVQARSKVRIQDLFAGALGDSEDSEVDESEAEDPEVRLQGSSRSQQVTDILCDLPLQIFEKVPTDTSTGASWCTLQKRSPLIKSDIFHHLRMLEVAFPSRIVFSADYEKWEDAGNKAYLPSQPGTTL